MGQSIDVYSIIKFGLSIVKMCLNDTVRVTRLQVGQLRYIDEIDMLVFLLTIECQSNLFVICIAARAYVIYLSQFFIIL